jgi:hypothetical protein
MTVQTSDSLDPYFRKIFKDVAARREAVKKAANTGVHPVPAPVRAVKSPGGYPIEWQAISWELEYTDEPLECFGDRWKTMAADAGAFLERWGRTAHLLGWDVLALYGVHSNAPAARFDVMGLIPVLNGGRVIAITKEGATFRAPSGATLTYRRTDQTGAVTVTWCAHNGTQLRRP